MGIKVRKTDAGQPKVGFHFLVAVPRTSHTNLHDVGVDVIGNVMAFPDLWYLIVFFGQIHYVPVL